MNNVLNNNTLLQRDKEKYCKNKKKYHFLFHSSTHKLILWN